VKVFVNPKQRRKLSVSERLRRLLRQNERRKPHRQQQNQQRTNLHAAVISTHFAHWKALPAASRPLRAQILLCDDPHLHPLPTRERRTRERRSGWFRFESA